MASYPDGLGEVHAARRGRLHRHASLFSLIVLGALMALALSGLLAGGRAHTTLAAAPGATLGVSAPRILRNGEFFEMRVAVEAKVPITDATLAIPPELWRDMTINSHVPAASEEAFEDGAFAFHYGPLKPGERLEIKIDGQINPPLTLGTRGFVRLQDGDRAIVTAPVAIGVLP